MMNDAEYRTLREQLHDSERRTSLLLEQVAVERARRAEAAEDVGPVWPESGTTAVKPGDVKHKPDPTLTPPPPPLYAEPEFLSGTPNRPDGWGLNDAYAAIIYSQTLVRELMDRAGALDGGPRTPDDPRREPAMKYDGEKGGWVKVPPEWKPGMTKDLPRMVDRLAQRGDNVDQRIDRLVERVEKLEQVVRTDDGELVTDVLAGKVAVLAGAAEKAAITLPAGITALEQAQERVEKRVETLEAAVKATQDLVNAISTAADMAVAEDAQRVEKLERQAGRIDDRIDNINTNRARAHDALETRVDQLEDRLEKCEGGIGSGALAVRVEKVEKHLKAWEAAPLCRGVVSCYDGLRERVEKLEAARGVSVKPDYIVQVPVGPGCPTEQENAGQEERPRPAEPTPQEKQAREDPQMWVYETCSRVETTLNGGAGPWALEQLRNVVWQAGWSLEHTNPKQTPESMSVKPGDVVHVPVPEDMVVQDPDPGCATAQEEAAKRAVTDDMRRNDETLA